MRLGKWWWVIIIAFVGLNILLLWPRAPAGARLPYSVFVAQVRQGEVESVHIRGAEITGVFREPQSLATLLPEGQTGSGPVAATSFHTHFPESVGHPDLVPLLSEHEVLVDVSPPASPWIPMLLINALPLLLIFWLFSRSRQSSEDTSARMQEFGRSRARIESGARQKVTFADVAGCDEAKADLEEVVEFLRNPIRYHEMGAHVPRGILLVGPPGTGKTLMARAISGEAGVPFFHINATEFVEIFVGVGASRVRDLFEQSKKSEPAIVFIDELDAVGRKREGGMGNVSHEREQTLNQLLVEMDGFEAREEVIVMAATNRPDVLDSALLRPGRFDRQVTVGLPDREGRVQILRVHTRHLILEPDVDLETLARITTGFSGADLANLANEAALTAVRRNHRTISRSDFEEAMDKILLGGRRPTMLSVEDREVVAYHEGGHALVAWKTPGADAVHKVTIIPHGRALGVTQQLPGEDRYNYSRTYLLGRLAVMLGGRAAEDLALGEITTGAEQDLVQASRLVRRMITQWGMGDLGLAAFEARETESHLADDGVGGGAMSPETSARVERNVQAVLDEQYAQVRELLQAGRERLDALAQRLLEEETLSVLQLEEVLGPRPVRLPRVLAGLREVAVGEEQRDLDGEERPQPGPERPAPAPEPSM